MLILYTMPCDRNIIIYRQHLIFASIVFLARLYVVQRAICHTPGGVVVVVVGVGVVGVVVGVVRKQC